MLPALAAWGPNHGTTRGVPWRALYYTLLPQTRYVATQLKMLAPAPLLPSQLLFRGLSRQSIGGLTLGTHQDWTTSLIRTPHSFPLHLDPFGILFSIPWGCARSGLRLPLQPSHTFFMTHLPSWHSNYIAFLSVVWITQAFSGLKVLCTAFSWPGPLLPLVFTHLTSGFTWNCHFFRESFLYDLIPLLPSSLR